METDLWTGVAGTVVLWSLSAALAITLGLLLAGGSLARWRALRWPSRVAVNLTRGVPTSILVLAAGIAMLSVPPSSDVPAIFPGTEEGFQLLAVGVVAALALGSAGHLAQIFRAAWTTIDEPQLREATVLGMTPPRRMRVLVREATPAALAPTGARLVHHLHNTAFAALFPVTELFGYIQGQANSTFRVLDYAILGVLVYTALSALIWSFARVLEAMLPGRRSTTRSIVPAHAAPR